MPSDHSVPSRQDLDFAQQLADAGRRVARDHFRRNAGITMKADDSPVTPADLAVEARLREMIMARHPDHGIIGEEHAAHQPEAEYIWVIDPIDGTRSFAAGRPMFGMLIALTHRGRPILGVVDMPMLDERWVGAAGWPTLFNGQPARSRALADYSSAILMTSSPQYLTDGAAEAFANVESRCGITIYDAGTEAYGLIASGFADIIIGASYGIVDYLAAVPVIEGAGGVICDWQGQPLGLGSGDRFLVLGDPSMLEPTLKLLAARPEAAPAKGATERYAT